MRYRLSCVCRLGLAALVFAVWVSPSRADQIVNMNFNGPTGLADSVLAGDGSGSDELNPLPGVMIAPGTFEWVDFPDAGGTHPDTVELGTWAAIPLPPFDPAFPSLVIDVSVDAGSTIDGVGFPSAEVFDVPGGFVVRRIADDILTELSNGEYGSLPTGTGQIAWGLGGETISSVEDVFALFLATTGTTLTITVTPVPEPSSMALLGIGLLGLGLIAYGWRQRRRA